VKYDPKDANLVLPEGTYDASIARVDEEDDKGPLTSKKTGEAMQKVTFDVYAGEKVVKISQYFTAKSMLWLYKRLASALGQEEPFKAGQFDALNHVGDNLQLELIVKDSPQYGEQNQIAAFLPKRVGATTPQAGARTPRPTVAAGTGGKSDDADIPF